MLRFFARIVFDMIVWIGLLGGLTALVTGVALVLKPALVVRFGEIMNRWISTRQAMRRLVAPIVIEGAMYRHHRLIGAIIALGALYALHGLLLREAAALPNALVRLLRPYMARWVAEGLYQFIIVVNALGLLAGVMMLIRPGALKSVEAWANRRFSTRHATKSWDIPRAGPDRWIYDHPRSMGAALAVAGSYILFALIFQYLLRR